MRQAGHSRKPSEGVFFGPIEPFRSSLNLVLEYTQSKFAITALSEIYFVNVRYHLTYLRYVKPGTKVLFLFPLRLRYSLE